MLTRRRFLALFPAFAVPAIAAPAQSFTSLPFKKKRPIAPPAPVFVYFGTDTQKGGSKGIYQSRFDPKTGQLTTPILAAATARPSHVSRAVANPSCRPHLGGARTYEVAICYPRSDPTCSPDEESRHA